jgi:hypothetical protein
MTSQSKTRPPAVWLLINLHLFLALGALPCGALFLLAPDGRLIGTPLSNLQHTPFSDFLVPGALLFTLLGVYPLAVAFSLWKKPAWRWPNIINPFQQMHFSWAGSLAAGVIVLTWITFQVAVMPLSFLHLLYWAWGIALILLTLLPQVRRYYGNTN